MESIIDLSLSNQALYNGCEVVEVGGRLTLITSPNETTNIIGRNVNKMIKVIPADQRKETTLSGPMAIWAHLVVFHQVVHRFGKVYYDDGRGNKILIAQP